MTRFLHGTSVLKEVKALISKNDAVDLAVAYWGADAFDTLGITGDTCSNESISIFPYPEF